jgi:hypothetical protein
MTSRTTLTCFLLGAATVLSAAGAAADGGFDATLRMADLFGEQTDAAEWTEIRVPPSFEDALGETRSPGCSGAPVPAAGEAGPAFEAADRAYAFFLRPGDPKRLAITWDGGGACWDSTTCIDSVLADDPLYEATVDETPEALGAIGGIDAENGDNPLAGFTRVFIPYCTADLFFGAKETTYTLPDGSAWTIHHRGHDNVLAVLDRLTELYADIGQPPEQIVLLGSSAGGYGALYSMPAVARSFPLTPDLRLVSDSANGIVGRDLYDQALTPGGVWGAWRNLAPELEEAFLSEPNDIVANSFRDLGWSYPSARLGQYTRAYDAAQIFFYNVSKHIDRPTLWTDPTQLFIAALEWSLHARGAMWQTAWMTWNYRFYLARGAEHTILGLDELYRERSARGVPFSAWLADMLGAEHPYRSQWRNLSCAPYCLPSDLGELLPTP